MNTYHIVFSQARGRTCLNGKKDRYLMYIHVNWFWIYEI